MEKNYKKVTLIYLISLILVSVIFLLGYLEVFASDVLATLLIQLVVMAAIPLLLYTLLVSKSFKKTFKDAGFKKISTKMVLISFLIGIVLYLLNTFVANFSSGVLSLLGYENLYKSEPVKLDYALILKEFILTAIIPGICEEILHRGILLQAGKKFRSPRYCLILSSILFGLTHLNINQFFYAAVIGLMIGHASLVSGSIYPAMIIHFMNNALNTYFYYGTYLDWPLAGGLNKVLSLMLGNILMFFVIVIILICLLVYLYILLTHRLFVNRKKYEISKIIKKMRRGTITIEDAIAKVDLINRVFALPRKTKTKSKPSFSTDIFVICSIIIGALITISTFIWGIL